jgi:hypothetical protein
MAILAKFLGGATLTNSDQDIVVADVDQTVRISSVMVSNGSTGGTLTLKFYDDSATETYLLENATVLSANERYVIETHIYLEEGDKLIASAATTTDADISVFGLISPVVLPPALSGHTIENEGTPLTQRSNLNFIGSLVTASDNVDTTDVTIDFLSSEITGKDLVTVAPTDNLLITDASDSDNLKRIVASDFLLSASASLAGDLNVNSFSIVDTNSNELLKFGVTASAVNEVTITNNSAGNSPKISATGGDTNIGLTLEAKGTGVIRFDSPVLLERPGYNKAVDMGSGNDIDCSLGAGVYYRSVPTGTVTFAFTNTPGIPTDYNYDIRLVIIYTGGTINLPTATYINETVAPTFTTGNTYVIPFFTLDGGSTWYVGGK